MGKTLSSRQNIILRLHMKTSDYKTLLTSQPEPHILKIEMNRPEAANAFNTQMAYELTDLFEQLSLDAGDCRVVVLTATGSKAFCAGGDLKERNGMTDKAWEAQHLVYERMVRAVMSCPVPVIAAVNGAAYGGGCELAACADFVYAADTARFAQTEVKLGIIPGAGGTQNLPRAVGERRAKELILTGDVFTSQQARDWGLVNLVCAAGELQTFALETARKIAANGPVAVRQAKQAISRGMQMSLSDGLAFEIEAYNRTIPTQDRREGVAAFNEKRPPKFSGE